MVDLAFDGQGCGGSTSDSSARLFPNMLVLALEEVSDVSDIVVRYEQKVLV